MILDELDAPPAPVPAELSPELLAALPPYTLGDPLPEVIEDAIQWAREAMKAQGYL